MFYLEEQDKFLDIYESTSDSVAERVAAIVREGGKDYDDLVEILKITITEAHMPHSLSAGSGKEAIIRPVFDTLGIMDRLREVLLEDAEASEDWRHTLMAALGVMAGLVRGSAEAMKDEDEEVFKRGKELLTLSILVTSPIAVLASMIHNYFAGLPKPLALFTTGELVVIEQPLTPTLSITVPMLSVAIVTKGKPEVKELFEEDDVWIVTLNIPVSQIFALYAFVLNVMPWGSKERVETYAKPVVWLIDWLASVLSSAPDASELESVLMRM